MIEAFEFLSLRTGVDPRTLFLLVIAFGGALAVFGLTTAVSRVDPATARLTQTRQARVRLRQDKAILQDRIETSNGILKTFLPKKEGNLSRMKIKLIQAGYAQPGAVQVYTMVRVALGLGLPALFVLILGAASLPAVTLPFGLSESIGGLTQLQIFQVIALLTFIGYFLPTRHVEARARETRTRIMESFPNALDLLQISVEAGLGLDAAMTRVGNELAIVCPQLSFEFLTVQRQIQAGRSRETAMREMADRCGVDTVSSFVKVVQQSLQFGTPLTEALHTYAQEMRLYRELAAQEMANKLPVKMSIVLASLMLPALVLMTVGPTLIRWVSYSN